MTTLPVSLVTTVYNESCTIGSLLDSVAAGSAWPEEIIVVDGGSRDETVARIESWAARHREIPVRLIKNAQRIGIAAGRNMAIRAARSNTIAVIDGGCEAERHWLRKLAEPFSMPDPPDVVAGWYEPRILTAFHARIAQALVPRLSEVDAATFLPSSRSVAFTRRAWDMAGGYPERLRFAGEDTLFDLRLKEAGCRIVFAPEAIVKWGLRDTMPALLRQYYGYGFGDGEAGIMRRAYLFRIAACLFPPLVALTGKGVANFWLRYRVYLAIGLGWLAGSWRRASCR